MGLNMDSLSNLYLKRAQNELNLSLAILKISDDKNMPLSIFKMQEDTYYNPSEEFISRTICFLSGTET